MRPAGPDRRDLLSPDIGDRATAENSRSPARMPPRRSVREADQLGPAGRAPARCELQQGGSTDHPSSVPIRRRLVTGSARPGPDHRTWPQGLPPHRRLRDSRCLVAHRLQQRYALGPRPSDPGGRDPWPGWRVQPICLRNCQTTGVSGPPRRRAQLPRGHLP